MNIFLIGYRCTGKTTVGMALANCLSWSFVDTDQVVVETSGMSIARLVAENGWPFFRNQEHEALKGACAGNNRVVATGGGIVIDARNHRAMAHSGSVVWLTASHEIIRDRMLGDNATIANRPSLTGQGLLEEIETVLTERRPLYEAAADLVIDTDQATVEEIGNQIIRELKLQACGDEAR